MKCGDIKIAVEGVGAEFDARWLLFAGQLQGRGGMIVGQCGEHGQPLRAAFFAVGRKDVEHTAAADGVAGRGVAEDEAVAGQRANVTVNGNLCPIFCAGGYFVDTEQGDAGRHILCPEMQVYRCPVLEGGLAG